MVYLGLDCHPRSELQETRRELREPSWNTWSAV
ncbi:hypothetical protein RSOL_356010 [Rhizoctonia solani AG-3 Rhs1AP]|uniref:Uncharacterized protein n=1 Tax=Rhizoctonia solani AG-3 Rhs1AP TaxID=1086054 RepID=X8J9B6_9AGAM|nr:hypothetical protein RSOL_356010 [Rhizoctonia solani AG-3 Rhs1AP]